MIFWFTHCLFVLVVVCCVLFEAVCCLGFCCCWGLCEVFVFVLSSCAVVVVT